MSGSIARRLTPLRRLTFQPPLALDGSRKALSNRAFSSTRIALAKSKGAASAPEKPLILEKPEKFNPPSHGTRLPKRGAMPRHYGGELPKAEIEIQKKKEYPTMMAPEGTWAHWFWTNPTIHSVIAFSVLFILGVSTFFLNFTHTSPFRDLLPPISDAVHHPIEFVAQWNRVLWMAWWDQRDRNSEEGHRRVNDAMKRRAYLTAHDVEKSFIERYLGDSESNPEAERRMELAEEEGKVFVETSKKEAVKKKSFGWWGMF